MREESEGEMYYELIILGTLMAGPFHGYLIAKIMQNINGPYGKLSKGRLYPLLTRLEEGGLIEAESISEQPGEGDWQVPRSHIPSRRYRISETGRRRFHHLMMDTTSYQGDYQKVFLQKVAYFSFLQPAERLQLIEHYLGYCQNLVSYGTTRAEELALAGTKSPIGMKSVQLADLLTVMQHKIYQGQQELSWAERLREQVRASMNAPATPEDETLP